MLNAAEYREYVTGYPEGISYQVDNPDTGASYDFAGTADGALVYTVASLRGLLLNDGTLVQAAQERFLGVAGAQLAAAGTTPVIWACQHAEEASALKALLVDYEAAIRQVHPFGSISVQTFTPPAGWSAGDPSVETDRSAG